MPIQQSAIAVRKRPLQDSTRRTRNDDIAAAGEFGDRAGGQATADDRAEYVESLRDGRELFVYGEKVDDVTTHPAFRNSVRMTARMYDALHDPEKKDTFTAPTDTGSSGFTHPFFRTPYTSEDLFADRNAIGEWVKIPYGWMGRSPDYKASFLGTLGGERGFLRALREQRAALVYRVTGKVPVLESRDHQPAGGPGQKS